MVFKISVLRLVGQVHLKKLGFRFLREVSGLITLIVCVDASI